MGKTLCVFILAAKTLRITIPHIISFEKEIHLNFSFINKNYVLFILN
jgi:hypothetical protein